MRIDYYEGGWNGCHGDEDEIEALYDQRRRDYEETHADDWKYLLDDEETECY